MKASRVRRRLVGLAVISAVMIATISSPVVAVAPTTQHPGDLEGSLACDRYKYKSADVISKTGRLIRPVHGMTLSRATSEAQTDTRYGRVYTYSLDGTDARVVAPPAGWDPETASAAELKQFRFPPRPAKRSALRLWKKTYGHMQTVAPTELCRTGASAVSTHYSTNWAGGMEINNSSSVNTYSSAEAHWYQPSFSAVCPHASRYAIWAGLGGWGSGTRLIQNGTDLDSSTINGAHFWYELLNSSYDTRQVYISLITLSAGNHVGAATSYSDGTVYFDFWNYTTNNSAHLNFSSVNNQPASNFYQGNTAEFISEATSGGSAPGGLFYLREPSGGTFHFPWAQENGYAISHYSSWQLDEQNSGPLMQDSDFNGSSGWDDDWLACS